jgi:endonuclease/exonuclease/phosphatase family metal-dependent hydrolase
VRVLTMNLWALGGDWPRRRAVLVDGLRRLRPDLVAFQEAIRTDRYDQAAELLGNGYRLVHQSAREPDGQGITIASRWPVVAVREVDLQVTPRSAGFACATLIARIAVPPPVGEVVFANHLPSWQPRLEYERELQTVLAARALERLAGDHTHVVVAGDLDADPGCASVRFWLGRQSLSGTSVCYRDAWEAAGPGGPGDTFTPDNPLVADPDWPFRRIDHILVRCADHGGPTLAIRACRRVFDEPVDGAWASDHFGVLADLAVPAR